MRAIAPPGRGPGSPACMPRQRPRGSQHTDARQPRPQLAQPRYQAVARDRVAGRIVDEHERRQSWSSKPASHTARERCAELVADDDERSAFTRPLEQRGSCRATVRRISARRPPRSSRDRRGRSCRPASSSQIVAAPTPTPMDIAAAGASEDDRRRAVADAIEVQLVIADVDRAVRDGETRRRSSAVATL